MSLGMPKPQFISRFHNKSVCDILKNKKMKVPIVLEPVYANNCLSKEKYTAVSISEAGSMISQLLIMIPISKKFVYMEVSALRKKS